MASGNVLLSIEIDFRDVVKPKQTINPILGFSSNSVACKRILALLRATHLDAN